MAINPNLGAEAPSAKNLMLGAGKIYFNRWLDDGTPTVFRHLGNVPKFNLSPKIEKIQKYSSMDAQRELYAEAVKSMEYKATLDINEFTPYNLALALYGEEAIVTQEQKTVENERHVVTVGSPIILPYKKVSGIKLSYASPVSPSISQPKLFVAGSVKQGTAKVTASGNYSGNDKATYYLTITKANSVPQTVTDAEFTWKKGIGGKESSPVHVTGSQQLIAEGVSVTFAAGSSGQDLVKGDVYQIDVSPAVTTYDAGTDYILDDSQLRYGVIPVPATSNIKTGDTVLVSYTVEEVNYIKIKGGAVRKIEGNMRFLGDPSMGRRYDAEIWHVTITPSGDIGFIGDDWGDFQLEMTVMGDRQNHPDEPFFRISNI